jgi:hypothetical protein
VNLENTLYYFTHHSESIIQWLFLAILLLSALVIGRAIFARKESVASAGGAAFADGTDVQGFLQKILDQTAKLETVKLDGASPAGIAEVDVQVQQLKKDLAAREEELTKLKTSGATAPAGDADKLGARIKELETKLAEYEILEDDIADLSLYKDENVRLRSEIDKLKGGGAAPPASTPQGEDIVAEFAQAVTQEAPAAAPSEMTLPDTGNPMADFESAVNLERKMQAPDPVSEPAPAPEASAPAEPAAQAAPVPAAPAPVAAAAVDAPPVAAAPAAAAPATPAPDTEGDDLFAEFASPVADADANLDTDKMMEEMAALVSMEPAKGTSLNDEIDTEKMADEATRLVKS